MSGSTLDALWCWDSETGKRVLIDRQTGQVIAKWEDINVNS